MTLDCQLQHNGDLRTLSGSGLHLTSDPGCGGTLTASSTTTAFNLNLAGATPNAPAVLILSGNATTFGGLPLPYRLDAIGMTGCLLGVDPQLSLPGMADGAGAYGLSVPITLPSPALLLYGQAAHVSSATPLGVATTNVTRSIIGSAGFCAYIYNFTVDGPNAQNGPVNWQGCMLLQP